MKTWILSACLALAVAAGAVAATPADAHDRGNAAGKFDSKGGPGWNGGPPPWLGYKNPAWPHGTKECLGWQRKGDRWVCAPTLSDKRSNYVPQTVIAHKVYHAGYRYIFDIDRDGNRYKVKAVDSRGRRVLLTFNARNGDFIKRSFL